MMKGSTDQAKLTMMLELRTVANWGRGRGAGASWRGGAAPVPNLLPDLMLAAVTWVVRFVKIH